MKVGVTKGAGLKEQTFFMNAAHEIDITILWLLGVFRENHILYVKILKVSWSNKLYENDRCLGHFRTVAPI